MNQNRAIAFSNAVVHAIFVVMTCCIVIPFLLIVSSSLTSESILDADGFSLIPRKFTFLAYQYIFQDAGSLFRAYGVTIFITVVGTVASLLLTALTAYVISRSDYRYRGITTLYVFFTMLFNGGLVPFYILMTRYLHLENNVFSMIVPGLLNPFNIMIMKGFLSKIPHEVIESAKIDGASEWRIFGQMILPLSTPALATLGLFISFGYWNEWFNALLFIDNQNIVPLQLMLYRIMNTISFLQNNTLLAHTNLHIDLSQMPNLSARMAMVVLAAGPMMFVFPFFQKYFVQGLTVGSLKG